MVPLADDLAKLQLPLPRLCACRRCLHPQLITEQPKVRRLGAPSGAGAVPADRAADVYAAQNLIAKGVYTLEVTSLLSAWVQGGQPNHGLVLHGDSSGRVQYNLASREHPVPALRPLLILTYRPEIDGLRALAVLAVVVLVPPPASLLSVVRQAGGAAGGAPRYPAAAASGRPAMAALGVLAFCLVLWVTEAIPFHITGLLALGLLALLGVGGYKEIIAVGFGNDIVVFFIGVLVIGAFITRSGLGRRISAIVLSVTGNDTRLILLGFLATGTIVSMWITDMAVAAMLMPLARAILEQEGCRPKESNFGRGLMIAVAWGALVGGIATIWLCWQIPGRSSAIRCANRPQTLYWARCKRSLQTTGPALRSPGEQRMFSFSSDPPPSRRLQFKILHARSATAPGQP